jgi:hypothetical protein
VKQDALLLPFDGSRSDDGRTLAGLVHRDFARVAAALRRQLAT